MIRVICPACDGSGAGSATMRGPLGGMAEGICGHCRGEGEVTPQKRERLLAARPDLAPDPVWRSR